MSTSHTIASTSLVGLLALSSACVRAAGGEVTEGTAPASQAGIPATKAVASTSTAPTKFACSSSQTIQFGPTIPPDMSRVTSQTDADCFAWSQFVSLNWPASAIPTDGGTSDAGFGTPGDLSAVQWQTYMSADLLFLPDGGTPPPWGTQPEISPDCMAEAKITPAQARQMLPLMTASKFSEQFSGNSINQAFPFDGSPAWLGAQNNTNVWYDVRVSQPEYDYIVGAGLYNAANQVKWVDGGAGNPVVLPPGSFSTNIGAIELKSAWMEVTNPQEARWSRYKLAPAVVPDPTSQKCRTATVALVGLHIIHKTAGQPSFVWATFEHVDNAPDDGTDAGTTAWNFYNAQCQPQTIALPANCAADGKSTQVTVGCAANVPPPYFIGEGCPGPVPTQVTRMTPIDSTAQQVNQLVQQQIGQAYPGSVWQNYLLVNTLWSTNPSQSPTKPVKKPLPFTGAAPSATTPIANTTMETYLQVRSNSGVSNCILCHQNAAIAGNSGWASDFSFVFERAQSPSSAQVQKNKAGLGKVPPAHPGPKMRRIIR